MWRSIPKKIKINLLVLVLMVLVLPVSINLALHQVRDRSRANVVTPPTPPNPPEQGFGSAIRFTNRATSAIYTNPIIPLDTFTLEAWIYPDTLPSNTVERYIFSETSNGTGQEISLNFSGNNQSNKGNGSLVGRFSDSLGSHDLRTHFTITPNQWHHIALVKSPTDVSIFIDGQLNTTATSSGSLNLYNPKPLVIGNYTNTPSNQEQQFFGTIDEVRISNTARYQSNFVRVKQPFVADANTLALYPYNIDIQDTSSYHQPTNIYGSVDFVTSTIGGSNPSPSIPPSPPPRPSPIPSLSPTPSPKPSPSPRPSPSPKTVCNQPCSSNVQCAGGEVSTMQIICTSVSGITNKVCRNINCPNSANCVCPLPSPRPSPSPLPSLPPNNPPLIITKKLQNARINRQYSHLITGIDFDKNDSLFMSATELPQGIRLTSCREIKTFWAKYIYCSLTGKATKLGAFRITLTLQDSQGVWDQKRLPLTVRK